MERIKQADREERLDKAILGACMGFGPVSAKEVCFCAGFAPSTRLNTLDDADFTSIEQALAEIRQAASSEEAQPVILMDENQKVLAMASFPLHYLPQAVTLNFDTISAMLEKASALAGSYVLPDKDRFKKLVKNELHRAENKLVKLDEEIAAAENAEEYKVRGDNLMTYQYQYSRKDDGWNRQHLNRTGEIMTSDDITYKRSYRRHCENQ
jgi:predicted ribosome quality control (RQC) complex YloA/Tae2 family protein